MPNLHSHAFQRAMAGLAERAGPEGDNFWRWREVMYRFLAILTPDDVEAIAAQLYVECLLHGYTSVAEFHYLHNAPDGSRYADPAELSHRVVAAAQSSRHRADAIAGAVPPLAIRRRATNRRTAPLHPDARSTTQTLRHNGYPAPPTRRRAAFAARRHAGRARAAIIIAGTAGRSTFTLPSRKRKSPTASPGAARARLPGCLTTRRSIIAGAWCTRRTSTQPSAPRLASSGAVAGLCQTTEANLGDGIFPAARISSRMAGASVSAAIPTSAPARSRNCAGSNTSAGWKRARAT